MSLKFMHSFILLYLILQLKTHMTTTKEKQLSVAKEKQSCVYITHTMSCLLSIRLLDKSTENTAYVNNNIIISVIFGKNSVLCTSLHS